MNSLIEFSTYASRVLKDYIERVHEELDIPLEILKEVIDKECSDNSINFFPSEGRIAKNKPSSNHGDEDNQKTTCIALIKTGARKGDNCGGRVSKSSTTGQYCGRHIKLDSCRGENDKSLNSPSKKKEGKKSEDEDSIIFRRNKWGNLAYGTTGLILKSDKEKIIIGKQLKEDIEDLSEEDISLCKMKRFRFIKDYSKSVQKEIDQ